MADQHEPPVGSIGPTRLSVVFALLVAGGIAGYALVPLAEHFNGSAPRIEWSAIIALVLIAGVLIVFAYTTYRTVHRDRRPMDPRRAVNFLMLAKASALVGALIAGGYLGFVLQFVDQLNVPLPRERAIRGLIAAVTGVVIVVSGLLLERACRIPKDLDD